MTSRPNHKTIQQRFAEVLRRRREAAGLSQEALAAEARLHRNCVGRLERAQMVPSLLVVSRIAEALGITMTKLISDIESLAE